MSIAILAEPKPEQGGVTVMKLEAVFASVLREPVDRLSDETSPKTNSKWDSLLHIELVLAIEAAYKVMFSASQIATLSSLGAVRQILQSKGVPV